MSEGTNKYNSTGGNTGSPLEHCVDNVNEIQDVPFPNEIQEYMELADAEW